MSLRRKAPDWSPRLLEPTFWIEASRPDTMYASNAGTGSGVADAGVVGYVRDLSGRGFDLSSAADDTTRPTWNVNGGRPYLNFDGSNDFLRRTSALGMYAAGSASAYLAVRGNPSAAQRLLGESGTGGNPIYFIVGSNDSTASTANARIRTDAAANTIAGTSVVRTSVWADTDIVYGVEDDGANLTPYVNGSVSTALAYTRGGSLTLNRFNLGAIELGSVAQWFTARVYAVVVVHRVLSARERVFLNRYLGAKMGLLL